MKVAIATDGDGAFCFNTVTLQSRANSWLDGGLSAVGAEHISGKKGIARAMGSLLRIDGISTSLKAIVRDCLELRGGKKPVVELQSETPKNLQRFHLKR